MTIKEIIDGLKFTIDMFLFDPTTGETYKEPRNDMDKTTIDACKGAIVLLEQTRWIPVSERLPKENISVIGTTKFNDIYETELYDDCGEKKWYADGNYDVPIVAWLPLPEPYKAES